MDIPNTKPNHITFSLQQDDDLVDHDQPYLISFQPEDHTPDLHEHVSIVDGKGKSSIKNPAKNTRGGKHLMNKPGSSSGGPDDDQIQKKLAHREIERQRRQEMAKLYASLRDLLPLEFIKGSRSISDHMTQAVHYIKETEEKIKVLHMIKDQLKKDLTNNLPNSVSVSLCNGGFEIAINSCLIEEGFMLSSVLNTLVEQGLNVTSCTLTKVNDRLIHSIQTEASDAALIDPSVLQQRLVLVANNHQLFS